ncbi:MAG TPA: hypothetical protein DDW42_03610 [Desulfobacteraceae bacterium]|nr:hypothetical protein [Desulfobacteraceae bacterium]
MTHEDIGHFAKKHPQDRKPDPKIAEAVKQGAANGEISCAVAHKIASDLNVLPKEVGFHIDYFEMQMVKCQLGLYGYGPRKGIVKPMETVPEELDRAIRDSLTDGRLFCKSAWDIAERLGIGKMEVSSACEALNIRISSCQLGAF